MCAIAHIGITNAKTILFFIEYVILNTVTNMNLRTFTDTGTDIGMATSIVSVLTTNTDMAMNTGTTTDTDINMVI